MLFLSLLRFDSSGDLAYVSHVCGFVFFQGLVLYLWRDISNAHTYPLILKKKNKILGIYL